MLKAYLGSLLFFLPFQVVLSQSTAIDRSEDYSYRKGMELMVDKKYTAAIQAFEDYSKTGTDPVKRADASYFTAFCALQNENNDGEVLIERFIEEHPNHAKAAIAYFELAKLKYDSKDYRQAILYFEKLYLSQLSSKDANEARFKLGYSYFTQKEFDKAYEQFNELKTIQNQYQLPASYYAGYINFQNEEYDRAYYDFERAGKNEAYKKVVPSLLVRILYKQQRYDELITYGEASVARNDVSQKKDIYLYLGEAYYRTGNYEKAGLYFDEYMGTGNKKTERAVLYRIADTQQKSGENEMAIDNFKQVAILDDSLGQYASYHLGNLYLKTGNKNFALAAFQKASEGDDQGMVVEEASFKFAKVNFDLGNYDAAIKAMEDYQRRFPQTNRIQNVDEILTEAYLRTKNYDAAIEHFESLQTESMTIRKAYQKVTFFKGTELFNDQKFEEAIQMFDRSIQYAFEKEFVLKSYYWKGEAYSIGSMYDQAIDAYAAVFKNDPQQTSPEYLMARYGAGYVYFNTKEYDRALPHFKYYTEQLEKKSNKMYYNDALLRLADCYYTQKDYSSALVTLNKVIDVNENARDYAYFRKGVIYGIMGDLPTANSNFDKVIKDYDNSRYLINSLFQKGRFNFESGNYEGSIALFSKLINQFSESPFVPYAYQSRAIAYSNLNQLDRSSADYKAILDKYPNHEVANNALLGLQESLASLGKTQDFESYLVKYKNANPGSEELENIEYQSAKNLYFNQNYNESIAAIDRFLQSYPESGFNVEAKYYRADAYYRLGDLNKALNGFYSLERQQQFNRYNRIIQRIMEIEYEKGNFSKAIQASRRLASISTNKKESYAGWRTMMKSYFEIEQYDSASFFAERIIEKGLVDTNSESEALVYLGKSAFYRGDNVSANDFFVQTVNTAKDENAAEAQYYIALMQYESANYRESIETLFNLNSNFGTYDLWLGKSFLLIAENYISLDELFQAKATLNSVIEHAENDEIIVTAKSRLAEIDLEAEAMEPTVPDTLEIDEPAKNE